LIVSELCSDRLATSQIASSKNHNYLTRNQQLKGEKSDESNKILLLSDFPPTKMIIMINLTLPSIKLVAKHLK